MIYSHLKLLKSIVKENSSASLDVTYIPVLRHIVGEVTVPTWYALLNCTIELLSPYKGAMLAVYRIALGNIIETQASVDISSTIFIKLTIFRCLTCGSATGRCSSRRPLHRRPRRPRRPLLPAASQETPGLEVRETFQLHLLSTYKPLVNMDPESRFCKSE